MHVQLQYISLPPSLFSSFPLFFLAQKAASPNAANPSSAVECVLLLLSIVATLPPKLPNGSSLLEADPSSAPKAANPPSSSELQPAIENALPNASNGDTPLPLPFTSTSPNPPLLLLLLVAKSSSNAAMMGLHLRHRAVHSNAATGASTTVRQ